MHLLLTGIMILGGIALVTMKGQPDTLPENRVGSEEQP